MLAQIIEVVAVPVKDGIAVLALERRQLGVLFGLKVVDPYIAGHSRGVVLAPVALVAFLVVIEDLVPGPIDDRRNGRLGQDESGLSSRHRDAIELGEEPHGVLNVGGRVLAGRREEDALVVRRESARDLGRRVIGQAPGLSAAGRHDENVEVAEAVGGEGDRLPVVAPDGRVVVGLADGQGEGLAARCRDPVNVAFIAK